MYHKRHPFKVCNPVVFSALTVRHISIHRIHHSIFTLGNYHTVWFQSILLTLKLAVTPDFSPCPPLPTLDNHGSTFCLCRFSYSGHFMKMKASNMWSVTGFFHLSEWFKGLSCCSMYQLFNIFLLLNTIAWSGCIIFYLSIHQLTNTWVVFTF